MYFLCKSLWMNPLLGEMCYYFLRFLDGKSKQSCWTAQWEPTQTPREIPNQPEVRDKVAP